MIKEQSNKFPVMLMCRLLVVSGLVCTSEVFWVNISSHLNNIVVIITQKNYLSGLKVLQMEFSGIRTNKLMLI